MNKTRKIAIAALACILLLMAMFGAAYLGELFKHPELAEFNEDSHIYPGYSRTITDSAGRNITIYKPVESIITLNSDAAEAVRTLGEVEKIAGVIEGILKGGKEYFPELADRPSVGTWKEFDYERIVEIAGNNTNSAVFGIVLVICYVHDVSEVKEKLYPFEHIVVVGLDLYKAETLDDEIANLGYILEREDRAKEFIGWRYEKISKVKSAVDGLEKPKVYIERGRSKGTTELGTFGKGSALDMISGIAGGNNIARDIEKKFPKMDWEWVVSPDQNPDVIIKKEPGTWLGVTDRAKEMREEVLNRPGAENVSAIKNGEVYILNRKMNFGLGNVVGLTYWAKIFHPDVDLDPEAVYREYLEKFQGLEFQEDKVVVYPKMARFCDKTS